MSSLKRIRIEWIIANNYLFLSLMSLDSKKQGYMMENSVRMSMAGLVLVVLLVILAEDWNSHRISQGRLSGIDCTKMEQTVTVGGDGSYRWGGFLQKGKPIRGSDPFAECKA